MFLHHHHRTRPKIENICQKIKYEGQVPNSVMGTATQKNKKNTKFNINNGTGEDREMT